MTFEELVKLVQEWGDDKGITDPDNVEKQFMKFIEEVFEFKAEMDFLKWTDVGDKQRLEMEMGDILVTLIILAEQLDIDLTGCLALAYDKIKDRKGKTIDGVFVKEEDLD